MPSPWFLLACLLMVGAAGATGFWHGREYEQGVVAERDLRVLVGREARLQADIAQDRTVRAAVTKELLAAEADRDEYQRRYRDQLWSVSSAPLIEEAPRAAVGTAADPAVPARAEPGTARLAADGVRLWNRALGAGALPAERAGWLESADAASGPADLRRIFDNLAHNAGLLGACRAREAGWHQWATEQGLMTP